MKRLLLMGLSGVLLSTTALAHNVVSGVYAEGMLIEGEIGFSNGDMALPGVVVKVFNESGEAVGQTQLEEGGLFTFKADTLQTHVFRADISSGHVAEMVLEADELSPDIILSTNLESGAKQASSQAKLSRVDILGEPGQALSGADNLVLSETRQVSSKAAPLATDEMASGGRERVAPTPKRPVVSGVSVEELQSIVRKAVAQQVRPLQKELRAYKEKVMFRDIAGGLGFIFGLFGVAAWMASKRKQKDA